MDSRLHEKSGGYRICVKSFEYCMFNNVSCRLDTVFRLIWAFTYSYLQLVASQIHA